MSDWLEATREVYAAGGELMPHKATQTHEAYYRARRLGFLAPIERGGAPKPAKITQRGIDLVENRLTMRAMYDAKNRIGRAPNSQQRMVATWLMALPRTNEVRL